MTTHVTPPLCTHCGQPMQFLGAGVSFGLEARDGTWDESWRCPEGRWSFRRTIPAPPGYSPVTLRAPARRRRGRTKAARRKR